VAAVFGFIGDGRRGGKAALAVLLLALLCGCARRPDCAAWGGEPAVTVQLLFGRSLKGGGEVDAAAWRDFLATSVTPRFPDGLTVLEGSGQWRDRATGRIGAEPSTIVEIVTDATPGTAAKLSAIREEYKIRFHQESVGLVANRACASF
jgi:hypothetical protein